MFYKWGFYSMFVIILVRDFKDGLFIIFVKGFRKLEGKIGKEK